MIMNLHLHLQKNIYQKILANEKSSNPPQKSNGSPLMAIIHLEGWFLCGCSEILIFFFISNLQGKHKLLRKIWEFEKSGVKIIVFYQYNYIYMD